MLVNLFKLNRLIFKTRRTLRQRVRIEKLMNDTSEM